MADTIAPAGMHILHRALRYNKPNNLFKTTEVFLLLRFFNKTRTLLLFLGFQYLELQNNYKRTLNSEGSLFIDSGVGHVQFYALF